MKTLLLNLDLKNIKIRKDVTSRLLYVCLLYICISLISGEVFAVPLTLGVVKNGTAPQIISSPIDIYTYDGNVGDPMYFRFIPGNSDIYTFQTTGFVDTEGELFDSDGISIEVQDGGGTGDNFLISRPLIAGNLYYFRVTNYAFDGDVTTLEIVGGTLPVELVSFTANSVGKNIKLKWQTATEVNNYGFQIERQVSSKQTTVGSESNPKSEITNPQWTKVGFVIGAGNSNSPKEYSFVDENPSSGKVEYRIKQIDTDGKFKYYSNIAEINFNITDVKEKQLPTEFALQQNYPNPFNPTTKIIFAIPSLSSSSHLSKGEDRGGVRVVTLKVYDILGNEVATLVNEHKAPGYYEVEFNGSNLATGVYIYRLTAGSFTATKKLMLMK